jgi:hypothetical protein
MELRDIFKMEMYKNRNDKPYLLVIAILTAMLAVSTFIGIAMIEGVIGVDSNLFVAMILLLVFSGLGLWIFSLLYPFHLLNVDYKNKVMSLIFASGVSREKYYFVKISATILTCLIATLAILFIPIVTFIVFYPEIFVDGMQMLFEEFSFADITPFMLMAIFSLVAYYVTLTTAVIITKGKVAGIFLFFAFSFGVSMVQAPIFSMFGDYAVNSFFYATALASVIQTILFALIGLNVLRKQDL